MQYVTVTPRGPAQLAGEQFQPSAVDLLTDTLHKLAKRLNDRGEAARDFAQLNNRAQTIASNARSIQTSRWGIVENSEKLVADLANFADNVAAASTRFVHEAETNLTLVSALAAQAERVKLVGSALLHTDDKGGSEVDLRSFECTLSALKEKMIRASSAASDAEALAERAQDLAAYALQLKGGGREVEQMAAAISQALNAFAEEAQGIATRLSGAPDEGVPVCGIDSSSTGPEANKQSMPSGAAQVSGMGWL